MSDERLREALAKYEQFDALLDTWYLEGATSEDVAKAAAEFDEPLHRLAEAARRVADAPGWLRELLEGKDVGDVRHWCMTHDEPILMRFGASGHVIDEDECEIKPARLLVEGE